MTTKATRATLPAELVHSCDEGNTGGCNVNGLLDDGTLYLADVQDLTDANGSTLYDEAEDDDEANAAAEAREAFARELARRWNAYGKALDVIRLAIAQAIPTGDSHTIRIALDDWEALRDIIQEANAK